jgi:hypothetical protein
MELGRADLIVVVLALGVAVALILTVVAVTVEAIRGDGAALEAVTPRVFDLAQLITVGAFTYAARSTPKD